MTVDSSQQEHQTDYELAQAAARNDEAFSRLVSKYLPAVRSQCRRFCSGTDECNELVNDVFFRVSQSLGRFEGTAALATWINTIATRAAYRMLKANERQNRLRRMLEQIWITKSAPAPTQADGAASDQLRRCLETLGADDRVLLTLLYWDNLSIRESAERLGWSESNTKVRAHRARQTLKRRLEVLDD